MCLSKRSELRHIDPKARIERGISLIALASEALRHIDPKAKIERWDTLARLSKRRYDSLEKEF